MFELVCRLITEEQVVHVIISGVSCCTIVLLWFTPYRFSLFSFSTGLLSENLSR